MTQNKRIIKRYGLARVLSKMGLASRTQAALMIENGLVCVNGNVIHNPEFPVRMNTDRVTVQQETLIQSVRVVLMLNKPRGLITTRQDEHQRGTVYECLPSDQPWLAPVGRLDKASEGLLLFTNDPAWAAKITDPKSQLDKTYHVQVSGQVSEQTVILMQQGLMHDRDFLGVKSIHIVRQGDKNTWLEFVLNEGKNRHIRRLLQAFDIEVLRLIRIAISDLSLGDLAKGQCRELNEDEITLLNHT
jgi:23S rRNA pseudouridine2605 synthase